MSTITRFFLRKRRHNIRQEAKECQKRLLAEKDAKKLLDVIHKLDEQFQLGVEGSKRWTSWKKLVRMERRVLEQERLRKGAERLLERARKADLKDSGTLGSLKKTMEEAKSRWCEIHERLRHMKRPRAFVLHAVLRLAGSSRLEIASIFVAVLVGCGAIYTEAYYRAAVADSVWPYLTIEDLLDQGVRCVLQVAVVLIAIELFHFAWKRVTARGDRLRMHRWVLRHPVVLVCVVMMLTAAGTWVLAHVRGSVKQENFFNMKSTVSVTSGDGGGMVRPAGGSGSGVLFAWVRERSAWLHGNYEWLIGKEEPVAELATVLDGTVLRDVYLVGTTARTATFLQVCRWAPVSGVSEGGESGKLVPGCKREAPDRTSGSELPVRRGVAVGRVLTVDRALVVCHARGEACLDQEASPLGVAGLMEGVARLEDGVKAAEARVVRRIDSGFKNTGEHLNRHRNQIVARIDRRGAGSE